MDGDVVLLGVALVLPVPLCVELGLVVDEPVRV